MGPGVGAGVGATVVVCAFVVVVLMDVLVLAGVVVLARLVVVVAASPKAVVVGDDVEFVGGSVADWSYTSIASDDCSLGE